MDQEILFITTKAPGSLENHSNRHTAQMLHSDCPIGAIHRHTSNLLKALDYTSTPNTSPIPGPSTRKNQTIVHPHKARPYMVRFNLTTKETPEWHIKNNEEPLRNQTVQHVNLFPLCQKNPSQNV